MAAITQIFTEPGTFPVLIDAENNIAGRNDIFLIVDSTLGVVNLQLPSIHLIGDAVSVRVSVFDKGGMASVHAINVIASSPDQINTVSSISLTKNKGQFQIEVGDFVDISGQWTAQLVTSSPSEMGATGATGAIGNTGAAGNTGSAGAVGNTGATGNTGSIGSTGSVGATGSYGSTGSVGNTGAIGVTGATGNTGTDGATGSIGATGSAGNTGAVGSTGATGNTGSTGNTGASASTLFAEYVQKTAQAAIAPGTAIEYLTDNPAGVFDTIGITTSTGPGAVGTAFQLPVGFYMVDFENSADAGWSLAIYQGSSSTVLTVDNNTIVGASTATTWIHGRAIVNATLANPWIMISPVSGTQSIPTAGTAAGEFIARLTILKIG